MNEQPPPLPVARTCGLAIASLVLGILSFFCLGFITGIPALVLGVIALIKIGKSTGALKGQGVAIAGLCTGGIGMLVGTAILAAILLPWVLYKRMEVGSQTPPQMTEIQQFCQSLELYHHDNGAYPTTAQGLQALVARPADCPKWDGPYLDDGKVPNDAWDHPYVYRCPGVKIPAGFDLFSVGPDGKEGTEDDIGNW
jgi:general secretion pathway protein G